MYARSLTEYELRNSYLNKLADQLGYVNLKEFINERHLWMEHINVIAGIIEDEVAEKISKYSLQ